MILTTAIAMIWIGQQCQSTSFRIQLALADVRQLVDESKKKTTGTNLFLKTVSENQQIILNLIDKNIAKAQAEGDVKLMDWLIVRRQKLMAQNERLLSPWKDR